MTTTTPESRGRIAYTAYGRSVGFKAINGEPMPPFDDLDKSRRDGWIASAEAIWSIATTGKTKI